MAPASCSRNTGSSGRTACRTAQLMRRYCLRVVEHATGLVAELGRRVLQVVAVGDTLLRPVPVPASPICKTPTNQKGIKVCLESGRR